MSYTQPSQPKFSPNVGSSSGTNNNPGFSNESSSSTTRFGSSAGSFSSNSSAFYPKFYNQSATNPINPSVSSGGNQSNNNSYITAATSSPKLSSSSMAFHPSQSTSNTFPSNQQTSYHQQQIGQQQFNSKKSHYKQQYDLHQQHSQHKRNTPVTSSPHYHHHNSASPHTNTSGSYIFTPGDMSTSSDYLSGSSKSAYRGIHSFFASDSLRDILLDRNLLSYVQSLDDIDEETQGQEVIDRISQLPEYVDEYHSLYPLDEKFWLASDEELQSGYGQAFRVIDSMTASPYCLRRISEHQLTLERAQSLVEPWLKVRHPNIASLKSLTITDQFGSNDLLFIYDFCAGAETLEQHFFVQTSRAPSENVLWSFLCQAASALREIHSHNLAFRTFYPNKVLILPGTYKRFKLSCVGMMDTLDSTDMDIEKLKQKDFKQLGVLIVGLMCTLRDLIEPQECLNLIASHENISKYSTELVDLVKFLLKEDDINISTLISKLALKYVDELSAMHNHIDVVENELAKELENGRLFRLLVKLNFVAQHEDTKNKPGVADRQMIKLFCDYIFVQVSDTNQSILDFGHIVETLNKLDAGTNEKVLLMSRDEQSLMVVTYKDLKNVIKTQFSYLLRKNKI